MLNITTRRKRLMKLCQAFFCFSNDFKFLALLYQQIKQSKTETLPQNQG